MLPGSIPEGTRLGDYRIQAEIGRGGMGVVYKAVDVNLGRAVAIKVLPRELGQDPRRLERFRREARAAALVTHPNITTIHQVSEANGWPYIVFELMPGGTLQDRLGRTGALPWREAVELTISIARALAAIHAAGLVHRDLKPANVLLDAGGRAKLADFGLVHGLGNANSLTGAGELVGTALYLAPEQAGDGPVGPAADLYSLGCTLYALLTGQPPFVGDNLAVITRHLTARPKSPREHVPGIPEAVEAIVLRLLEKAPSGRGDAALLATELGKVLQDPVATVSPTRSLRSWKLALLAALVVGASAAAFLARGSAGPKLGLVLDSPEEGQPVFTTMPLVVSGEVKAITSYDHVRVGDREVRLEHDHFSLVLPADEKRTSVSVVADSPGGQRVEIVRHLVTSPPPDWYGRIPEERRPRRLPLPRGLRFDPRSDNESPFYVYTRGELVLEMVYVPPGPFLMGCDRLGSVPPEDAPEHEHPMPHGYWIGRYETTWGQYQIFRAATKRPPANLPSWNGHDPGPREPVVLVSFLEATEFCSWAGLRLPLEAEWEKAARGTTGRLYPWGDTPEPLSGTVTNYGDPENHVNEDMKNWPRQGQARSDRYPYTAPVGSFPRDCSPYGAFDMAGNVGELCQDWHDPVIYEEYALGRFEPPRMGNKKVVRGGSWNTPWWSCRTVHRAGSASLPPGQGNDNTGFRVALSEDE